MVFTGIVEEVGRVEGREEGRLAIGVSRVLDGLREGGSIAVNGACLTVIRRDESGFSVDIVPETVRRTNLGRLAVGDPVNVERPVAIDGRLDGHIVQGHVDGTGAVESIEEDGQGLMIRFATQPSIMRYVVEKGFIAVDGTSLTVVHCASGFFSVAAIPYTLDNGILGTRKVGDAVNLEVDIVAKYVERLAGPARVPFDAADEL